MTIFLSEPVQARDIYEGVFTVDGQTTRAGTNNAEDFANLLNNNGLSSLFANYSTLSQATVDASLRGVPAQLSYDFASTALRLVIPSAGVDETFTGATRDESQDLALEWLKGRGGDALTRVLQQAVATTSIDPVAGNPNSLMSQMGASDFGSALGLGGKGGGRYGFGARFGSYSAQGYDTDVYTLPLSTSFDLDNGRALLLDVPLTLTSTEAAQSYSGSFGVGLRLPINIGLPDTLAWSLTPMLRGGGVGSVDIGAVGGMWSASLTSSLQWQARPGTRLVLGNMISRLQTLPVNVSGYGVSYELTNVMYRNGIVATQDIGTWFNRNVQATVFAVDTRFTGDELYIKNYQEYGGYFSFGQSIAGGASLPLSVGVTLMQADQGYRGFSINLGSSF
ncbi:hypothetical protein [Falsiroseomonas sp. E2-1-a20]|uniref:hypothetical protein n=1 Tax=Falsiroseomonas sp. E2-1-a20 TaxID=3239300 RepID=UPI003F3139B0